MEDRSPAEDTIAAMAVFGNVLNQVDDEHLELATPCADWDVQALISHVVLGDASIPLLFDGKPLDLSEAVNPSILGPNPTMFVHLKIFVGRDGRQRCSIETVAGFVGSGSIDRDARTFRLG